MKLLRNSIASSKTKILTNLHESWVTQVVADQIVADAASVGADALR